jgi:hypothetical protein
MAAKKKTKKAPGGKFHVDLNQANWPDFSADSELQGFLNAYVSGVVKGKAKQGGWKSVALQISLQPKGGVAAASKTDLYSISICPKPPC